MDRPVPVRLPAQLARKRGMGNARVTTGGAPNIMAHLFGTDYTREQLRAYTGRLGQVGGIETFRYDDGRGQGVRALRFVTGSGFSVTAVVDRALDVAHADFGGIPLCWDSSNEIAAPEYYDPVGDGWLQTFFGGLFTTAGLTNFGPGGSDRYGAYGLHGRIDCLPAQDVQRVVHWEGDECTLEVTGTVRQTRVFGENLILRRHLSTRLGSRNLHLLDTVTNEGATRTPHMILYHCNGGFPILAPGARLYVSHSGMRPRDAEAEKGLAVWDQVEEPQAGFAEQVFIHAPVSIDDGRAAVLLANRSLRDGQGLGLAIRFDPDQLPALMQWRMFGQGTYVMGMEPANCPTIEGRVEAGRRGTLPFLEAGECREYDLDFEVLVDASEIEQLAARIETVNERRCRD